VNNIISITGDVGKEYNGIEPIVVNNEENLISANSAPIGVQEPLYFVQDDDEAVIIGLSGEYVTPSDIAGKLDTSSFESWQQGQYTNDLTAINEKINEVSSNIPSIEGLATEQLVEETSASIVSQIPSTAGLASETYVQEQVSGKASKSDLESVSGDIVNLIPDVSNFYTKDETSGASQLAEAFSQIGPGGDEEVNALVHSNSGTWNEVSSKLNESTFQEASGLFLTAIPQEYITESDIPNFISAKLDTDVFANVSGDFLTNEDLNGYATESFVENVSGDITALIPTDYVSNETLEQTSGNIVNLIPDTSEFITNASAESTYQPIGNYLSSNALDGYATQDWVTAQGYLTGVSIPESATWNDVASTVQTNSADWASHQDLSYISAQVDNKLDSTAFNLPDSATWNEVSTAYQNASATYLTAVDLTPYATTAEVDSISSMLSGAIDYVSANAGDEFPVSADEAIQYVQTNSANIDDTVTSYQTNSGTFLTAHQAISAEEWNDCYDNVNTNSGAWGGSALPISAGPGIKVNLVDNTLVFSNDETVLYSANAASNTIVLSEKATNFERLRLELQSYQSTMVVNYTEVKPNDNYLTFFAQTLIPDATYPLQILGVQFSSTNGITYNMERGVRAYYKTTSDWGGNDTTDMTSNIKDAGFITKVVGINRIAGGN
jgi:hypothetical protein